MSIRKMKLKDYGITPGRAAELKEMVKDKQYYCKRKINHRSDKSCFFLHNSC